MGVELRFIFFLLLFSCSQSKAVETMPPEESLYWKFNDYSDWIKEHQGAGGHIMGCDGLLFTSLIGIGGANVDISQFKDGQGKYYRTPEKDCYLSGNSGSEISKDMILGMVFYHFWVGDWEAIEEFIEYGKSTGWIVGRGPLSRTFVSLQLRATMAEAVYILSEGKVNHFLMRSYRVEFLPAVGQGYVSHLQVLHLLLRGYLLGLSEREIGILERHAEHSPNNALFQFAYHLFTDGKQTITRELLLKEDYFPRNSLPTTADRCSDWIYQREPGPDWAPCQPFHKHTGGELIFVMGLLQGPQNGLTY